MIFFENTLNYKIIDDTMTDEKLTEFLKEKGLPNNLLDESTRWWAFAEYYAHKNGLDTITSASFAYMISVFMSGMGMSAGTEHYFKEEELELDLIELLQNIKEKNDNENEQAKEFFKEVFQIYSSSKIRKYEYATEKIGFKLSLSEINTLDNVKGNNRTEKLRNLLSIIKNQ